MKLNFSKKKCKKRKRFQFVWKCCVVHDFGAGLRIIRLERRGAAGGVFAVDFLGREEEEEVGGCKGGVSTKSSEAEDLLDELTTVLDLLLRLALSVKLTKS